MGTPTATAPPAATAPTPLLTAAVLMAVLAAAPPVMGVPVAAYVAIALLLVGGISALPWLTAQVYDRLAPLVAQRLLPLLAVERARRMRGSAALVAYFRSSASRCVPQG